MPYLFSSSEDINGRSFIPLQDTPSIKATWSACITVENTFAVYMSANITNNFAVNATYDTTCFSMNTIPVPSYLIAVAIGDIEY